MLIGYERRARVGASRLVHRVGAIAASERAAGAVGVVVVGWLAAYATLGFPSWMANALQLVAAAVTLVMVFVIQRSQRRIELATQLHSSTADVTSESNHTEVCPRTRRRP